jgi:hypothetical protein
MPLTASAGVLRLGSAVMIAGEQVRAELTAPRASVVPMIVVGMSTGLAGGVTLRKPPPY